MPISNWREEKTKSTEPPPEKGHGRKPESSVGTEGLRMAAIGLHPAARHTLGTLCKQPRPPVVLPHTHPALPSRGPMLSCWSPAESAIAMRERRGSARPPDHGLSILQYLRGETSDPHRAFTAVRFPLGTSSCPVSEQSARAGRSVAPRRHAHPPPAAGWMAVGIRPAPWLFLHHTAGTSLPTRR